VTALVRAELLRLRSTRSAWGLLAAALILTLAFAGMVLGDVGGMGGLPRGSLRLRDALLGAASLGTVPVVLLGVLSITTEFHHRTATATFLATPRRWRVLVAKTIACLLIVPPVAVVLLAAPLTIGVLSGAIDLTLDADLVRLVARAALGFECWVLLGVGIGAAIRNQTVAVVVPLIWFGVVEQLLPSYGLGRLMPWLPGGASAALSGARFPGVLPVWTALLVFLVYVAALLLPGARAISTRDIT
jgi:ABC-type transport system involved in multi-copper enzyme maturation permease subunit